MILTTPLALTRHMVKTYSDIGMIRSYVLSEFGDAPSREAIAKMREEHLAREAMRTAQFETRVLLREDRERRRQIQRNAAKRYRARQGAAA